MVTRFRSNRHLTSKTSAATSNDVWDNDSPFWRESKNDFEGFSTLMQNRNIIFPIISFFKVYVRQFMQDQVQSFLTTVSMQFLKVRNHFWELFKFSRTKFLPYFLFNQCLLLFFLILFCLFSSDKKTTFIISPIKPINIRGGFFKNKATSYVGPMSWLPKLCFLNKSWCLNSWHSSCCKLSLTFDEITHTLTHILWIFSYKNK